MHRVQVDSWSEGPKYVSVDPLPAPTEGQIQLRVLAAGLHNVVRFRATGQHYSANQLPHIVGVDGVAKDETTGQLYYIVKFAPDFGTFSEYVNIDKASAVPVPEGIDPVSFAASVNPAMSSWMAITQRTQNLPKDFSVLIIGATSASGKLAVNVAKSMGAGKIVGIARNAASLAKVEGLDDYIVQSDPIQSTDLSKLDCDLILDYVYGDVTLHILNSLKPGKPVQYVQIGSLGQTEVNLSAALLRSKDLTIRGAGPGAWSLRSLQTEMGALAPTMAKWKLLDAVSVPLKDIETAWNDKLLGSKGRMVVVP